MPRELICLTGFDGAGKTTVADRFLEDMRKRGTPYHYVWGNLEPYISKLMRKIIRKTFTRGSNEWKDDHDYRRRKRSVSSRHPVLSKIYTGLIVAEYVLQIWFKLGIPLLIKRRVLTDRYVYDFTVNLATVLSWDSSTTLRWIERIQTVIPKADIRIIITVPPEVSMQRKDDIPSLEYLSERTDYYRSIMKKFNFSEIDGTFPRDDVYRQFLEMVGKTDASG